LNSELQGRLVIVELFTRIITFGLSYAIVLQMVSVENLPLAAVALVPLLRQFVCLLYSYISRLFALSHGMNEANSYRA
jgi:hypothetical protein